MSKEIHHAAFLIRWQAEGDQTRWRSTVENAYTGEKHQFADKNQLMRFIRQLLFEGDASASIEESPQPDSQSQSS
jgi:hypothetical protein